MPARIQNESVVQCLRDCLAKEGFSLSPVKEHGERGADIVAKRNDLTYHVEVIGYKGPGAGSGRARDFFEAFFHALSRLDSGAEHVVVAMPAEAESGFRKRSQHHRIAWSRIAAAFPELELWLVDLRECTYARTKWMDWLGPEESV